MFLERGNKVLISHRRLFRGDSSRYFVAAVDGYEAGMVRVTGYTWLGDSLGESYLRKPDIRTKVLSLASSGHIIYQLPNDLNLERLKFERSRDRLWLTDGVGFTMDCSENDVPKPRFREILDTLSRGK